MRLFVALPLPEETRTKLAMLCGGVPGATWNPPENMHLTLRFIGEASPPEADDIDGALAAIHGERFPVEIAGIGQFGDKRQVKVLWAGVRPNEALHQLRDRIESALVRAGLEPEGRKFKPHVTLARLKGTPLDRIGRMLAVYNDFSLPPFTADRFTLFSSHRGSEHRLYRAEADYPLDFGEAA